MLYREITNVCKEKIAVCFEIHTKHINTLCGQNVEFFNVKPDGTYGDHCAWCYYVCLESPSFTLFFIFRDLCMPGVGYHHPETCSIS